MQTSSTSSEQQCSNLVAELAQVKELVMQLKAHVDQTSVLNEVCKSVTPKMLSCIEKSIHLAQLHSPNVHTDFPCSGVNGVPRKESSGSALGNQQHKEMVCKKRKTMPKWTKQVRISSDTGGADSPIDDGHSWRKYGQKDILGAKYPRGYYRCTHRNSQGCHATKQVQRSDDDPQVFDIIYHGTHTCAERQQTVVPRSAMNLKRQQQQNAVGAFNQLLNFQTGLKVETEGLDCDTASFSFGSAALVGIGAENIFSSPSTPESYFSPPSCAFSNYDIGYKLQASESGFLEMISMANSACELPLMNLDFLTNDLEVDISSHLA